MFYRAPDPVLYAQQRVSEVKQRPVGRVLYATERAGQSIYQSIRENIVSDYTLKDLAARAVAEINPLLAAMIPEQHQINEALHALKEGIVGSNEYLEASVELQAQQIDVLDEIKNIQQVTVEKLDTLEAIAEGRYEPPRVEHKKQVEQAKQVQPPRAVATVKPEDQKEPEENEVVAVVQETVEEQKDFQEKQLEQLELIRANLEALNSYLTGSEQFGLAGLVDRIFNKYTAFLNRHPAFRGIHTLLSGFAKIKLGITKPGQVKGLITGAVKRFLGIGEEGPLQQLVSISAGQLDIQYKIYQMLKEEFKKTGEQYKLSEDTLSLFSKSPDEIIDEKISEFISKIPIINRLDDFKTKVEQKVKERFVRAEPIEQRTPPPTSGFLATQGLLGFAGKINLSNRPNQITNITKESVKEIKATTQEIRQALKEQQSITDKIVVVGNILEKKGEDLIGERVLKKVAEKSRLNKIENLTPEKIRRLRGIAAEKAQTTAGEVGIGFTSLLLPFLPSLTHFLLGNYRLAGKEMIYMIPGIGQYLALKNAILLYREYGGNIKDIPKYLKPSNLRKQAQNIDIKKLIPTKQKQPETIQDLLGKADIRDIAKSKVETDITSTTMTGFLGSKYLSNKLQEALENAKVRTDTDKGEDIYKQFKESFVGDAITRIPLVKAIEGAVERKLGKVLWGTFGTFFPMIYTPIEATKFAINRVWMAIKHPIKTWNFLVDTAKVLAKTAITIPDAIFRGTTTAIQKFITAPLRTLEFIAKITGKQKTEKYLKTIADGIVALRKDIINAIPRAISKALKTGIDKLANLLKDFTILRMGWDLLKTGANRTWDLISSLPNMFRLPKRIPIPGRKKPIIPIGKGGIKGLKGLGGLGGLFGKGLKFGLKRLPGLGLLAGGAFAVHKLFQGDLTGAGLELASGLASMIPGIGTIASMAIDAFNMSRTPENAEPIKKINPDDKLKTKQELDINKHRTREPDRSSEDLKQAIEHNTKTVEKSANVISTNVSNAVNTVINNNYNNTDDELKVYRMQPVIIKP